MIKPTRSFHRSTLAGGLLVVFVLCAAACVNVWQSRSATLAEGQRTLQLVARVLAGQIGQTLGHAPAASPEFAAGECAALLAGLGDVARDERVTLAIEGSGQARAFNCTTSAQDHADADAANDIANTIAVRAQVPGYPLVVAVGRSRDAMLGGWRSATHATLARTVAISAFVLVLLYLLMREARRQDRANADLRAGEQRWRAVFDNAPVGIVMLLPNQPYMVANPAFCRMVGYPLDALHALAPDDITHPDDVALTRAKVAELERGARAHVTFEKRYVHRDGSVIWTEMSISRLSGSGELDGMLVAVIDDVSARRAAEAERLRLEAQLRQAQKLEALGTFAGGIAHDFNNILSAILGYGERVFAALPADSPARRDAQQVLNAGTRASQLVERILAFSRSGMAARLPVQVASVVEETVDLFKAQVPPGVSVTLRIDAPDAVVLGDPTHLHQVVMNLCSNALHALDGDGAITVSVDEVAAGDANARHAPRHVRIGVADNGAGIAPEVRERIFDPFFTTRRRGAGTGLGLSLVDGIVKEYGGTIEVRSAPGEGACFLIDLPIQCIASRESREIDASTTLQDSMHAPQGQGETILLVDDERALVELGEEWLAELGYEPVGFASPQDALDAFLADPQRFDLVLTDQTMPEMSGIELIERLHAQRPDLPAVLVSGYGTALLDEAARAAGVRAVLKKPVDRAALGRAIRAALPL
ncbi:PAS domain-containing sensor histidine kinase [Paraburkholderia tropica]|uniref:histidine kinase n=1 Tax=Paraburkholderia tropica TaxID=92647 RepID=A0AAQ1JVX4_9BURK|nr:ATP-binding protein [Paraburkholderia tropica]RQN37530.1 response regulator [Paraburkholderia tropica]SEK01091.1 PAS domain S-box-containing protein [Paraburkholderia tropica]